MDRNFTPFLTYQEIHPPEINLWEQLTRSDQIVKDVLNQLHAICIPVPKAVVDQLKYRISTEID